jgi:hypothetical protein
LLLRARYRWTLVMPVFVIWCAALCLLGFATMRAAGVLLWMSLLIGAGLLVYPAYRRPPDTSESAYRNAA